MVNNNEFLIALFGADAPWVHVTDFTYDPGDIPKDRHLMAWKGDYFSRYSFGAQTNQYFTISNFYCDDKEVARRRKALFRHTPVIVLDDVKEKLDMTEVSKLPTPSWILETSGGSEQWGYILDTPCTDRGRVENLLDGLVANGLAPDGRDPGMKGVTRYVRLPDGYNFKASKLVNGQPFDCRITLWDPTHKVTIESLALPFMVDLDAVRRESRVDGAADVSDHPLLSIPEMIHVKEVRSDGRFDITCPWVDGHTGSEDTGTAVFTNDDGSIGFKCHHGNCQEKTGRDVLALIENFKPGFGAEFATWKLMRTFASIQGVPVPANATMFSGSQDPIAFEPGARRFAEAPAVSFMATAADIVSFADVPPIPVATGVDHFVGELRRLNPAAPEARQMAAELLKVVDEMPKIEATHWHDIVCDLMNWTKPTFREIIKDLRQGWYISKKSSSDACDSVIYIKEQNQFYDQKSRIFFTPDAFQNSYAHEDSEVKKTALQEGRVTKVDKLDYAPLKPAVFDERGLVYGNAWTPGSELQGSQGDVQRWLDHWLALDWGDHRNHMLQWMAFTLRHPDRKINHMLILGSGEGCGKDYLLYPLLKAMGENSEVISGEELLESFNDYILSTKYLHINEAELGDRKEALAVSNKLKPLAAAPPERLRINQKGIKAISVRNIINATMTTNSQVPLRLNGTSRRFYAVWSDLNPRDSHDNMTKEWLAYWEDRWTWMRNGGAEACIWYLRTQVDLTDFNPAAAPPMTEFLRDIREASKSPAVQTIEEFIQKKIGVFDVDLVTSTDASFTLRTGEMVNAESMYCDGRVFTPRKLGALMRDVGAVQLRARRGESQTRVWCIRDLHKYKGMTQGELWDSYHMKISTVRAAAPIKLVGEG